MHFECKQMILKTTIPCKRLPFTHTFLCENTLILASRATRVIVSKRWRLKMPETDLAIPGLKPMMHLFMINIFKGIPNPCCTICAPTTLCYGYFLTAWSICMCLAADDTGDRKYRLQPSNARAVLPFVDRRLGRRLGVMCFWTAAAASHKVWHWSESWTAVSRSWVDRPVHPVCLSASSSSVHVGVHRCTSCTRFLKDDRRVSCRSRDQTRTACLATLYCCWKGFSVAHGGMSLKAILKKCLVFKIFTHTHPNTGYYITHSQKYTHTHMYHIKTHVLTHTHTPYTQSSTYWNWNFQKKTFRPYCGIL